jgi:16S rRNA (adenine1518-N6/adenine1519-N6)-dimethyltransferase
MGSHSSLVKPYAPGPKKRFGQHFLRDTGVLNRIVRWIQPRSDDLFLEIGAGRGALTLHLAPLVSRLIAIELDRDCIPILQSELSPYESASIAQADILTLDLPQLIAPLLREQQRLRIAGNLPYNISTAIIEKLQHCGLPIHDMTFMVQTEVAQRITAAPKSRQYGYLSVHCQHHCTARVAFNVSPSCFVPRPRVGSSIISLQPKELPQDPGFEADFEMLGKAAFAHRRKTLANSLARHPAISPICSMLLQKAGIDGTRRAEDLAVSEFEALSRVYHEKFKGEGSKTA